MPFPMTRDERPTWEAPVIQLHADRSERETYTLEELVDEAAYALSQQHQDDLATFEAALTKELAAKGMPMVFIQPGAPGHAAARRRALGMLDKQFGDAPWHPDHKRDF